MFSYEFYNNFKRAFLDEILMDAYKIRFPSIIKLCFSKDILNYLQNNNLKGNMKATSQVSQFKKYINALPQKLKLRFLFFRYK